MQNKKVSLFKQKIKQARQNQSSLQNQNDSFPKAIKIDLQSPPFISTQQTNNSQNSINQNNTNIQSKLAQKDSQLYNLNFSTVLNETQMQTIQSQNWQTVDNMSQSQRQNFINMIQSTFPKKFVDMLKKKAEVKIELNQKNEKANQSNLTQQEQIVEIKENLTSLRKKNMPNIEQHLFKTNKKYHKGQEGQAKMIQQQNSVKQNVQEPTQNFRQEISKVKLNIKDKNLSYISQQLQWTLTSQNKQSLLSFSQVAEMIKSQNNQSQIVGSKLTLQIFKQLYKSKTEKEKSLIRISSLPFHLNMCVIQIYETLLLPIQNILQKTTFISCFIQMLVSIVEILTIIKSQLSKQMLQFQLDFLKNRLNYIRQTFKLQNQPQQQEQVKTTLNQSLLTIIECLKLEIKEKQNSKTIQEQISDLGDSKILIQIFLLEECLSLQEKHFYQNKFKFTFQKLKRIVKELQKSQLTKKGSKNNEFFILVDYLFQIVCQFNSKKRVARFYSPLIKSIFNRFVQLLNLIQQFLKYQLPNEILYKCLFLIKNIKNMEQMNKYIAQSMIRQMRSEQSNIIVYLNMTNYFCGALQNNQIQLLQNMMKWIVGQFKQQQSHPQLKQSFGRFFNPEQLFWDWIQMFIQPDQIYSLLDQSLLNQIFSYICSNISLPLKLPTEILKQIIQNYNYNSFGNDVFTKFLLFLAISEDQEIQRTILQQNMMRYPMLFYYAFQTEQQKQNFNINSKQKKQYFFGSQSLYLKAEKQNNKSKKLIKANYFSYESNGPQKQQVLKLIENVLEPKGQVKKIEEKAAKKINYNNFFCKYLMQPYQIKKTKLSQMQSNNSSYVQMF